MKHYIYIYMYIYYLCIMFSGIVWNSSCMIPRFPGPYTSMDMSLALLCLIRLDRSRVIFLSLVRYRIFRSRVISGYSRDISYMCLYYSPWVIESDMEMWDRKGGMMMYRYGSRTGFLGVLAPSVSIKDRSLWQCWSGDWIVLTACWE